MMKLHLLALEIKEQEEPRGEVKTVALWDRRSRRNRSSVRKLIHLSEGAGAVLQVMLH